MLIPKENRLRGREGRKYLNSFRGKPCESCGVQDETIVPAHLSLGRSSMSYKSSDEYVVALCMTCHSEADSSGPEWWVENILKPILKSRYKDWLHGR